MDRIERVQTVLEGRLPDRPPVSFWHHLNPDQFCGRAAAQAHVAHVDAYDLDFLKIMNDNGYPHTGRVEHPRDLASLTELNGDEPAFERQLDLIADLKRALGDRIMMATTIFNAWATLRRLVSQPKTRHRPPNLIAAGDPASAIILRFFAEDPDAVRTAVNTISASLANFSRRCMQAGADGVFLSVRDDWPVLPGPGESLYESLLKPSDLQILSGASAARFNLLHVCGTPVNLRAFNDYPVHAINWADRAAGPSLAEVRDWAKPVLCGGVDNLTTLPNGTPADCAREVADALAQAGNRPIFITPGCTYDPQAVPRANLEAVCQAVRA